MREEMELCRVILFGGTTEGRKLAEMLCKAKVSCMVSVATEYGESLLTPNQYMEVHQGRMDVGQMVELIEQSHCDIVIDATHPYAREVSKNVEEAVNRCHLPYYQLRREVDFSSHGSIHYVSSVEECIVYLKSGTKGNILLTTGSKTLPEFSNAFWEAASVIGEDNCIEDRNKASQSREIDRLYVRVLPSIQSIQICKENHISDKHIIAMQGPFSTEMNKAIMQQYHIAYLVTKASGAAGGFAEKLQAAQELGIETIVIETEKSEGGLTFDELVQCMEETLQVKLVPEREISLIGLGMGNESTWTSEAREALQQAQIVFGSKRLLSQLSDSQWKLPYYLAQDIIPYLKSHPMLTRVAVVFSGDVGFYSGAKKMKEALEQTDIECRVRMFSGISTISYLAARFGLDWQEAAIVSLHGRTGHVEQVVQYNRLTFVLLSGAESLKQLWQSLREQSWSGEIKLYVGCQLSYPEEKLYEISLNGALQEMVQGGFSEFLPEGMYACFIQNSCPEPKALTHGWNDEVFIRGEVPMTKEEVREVSICKLKLHEQGILYDIGSGTGSIAVECAKMSPKLSVYAIERKKIAVDLICQNCKKFGTSNVQVVEGLAPEAFETLPAPTHVFIGGSGGKLEEILQMLLKKLETGESMRIVLNAITMETVAKITELSKKWKFQNFSMIQLQVSRSKEVAGYHMMQGENPIYIAAFEITG
ncbi:MAG: precorrin-6Y C5,15-methyltransferase (decarboxylating) subunit CbiT [Lachnospiraceae bacterium]